MVGEDMNNTLYKPSNKFNPVGLIVLFLVMLLGGFAIYWVYELFNSFIPLIYIRIFLAVLASFGIGGIGTIVVKKFHIRAPIIALAVTAFALIFANMGRLASYCVRDFNKYMRDPLEEKNMDMTSQLSSIDPNSVTAEEYNAYVAFLSAALDESMKKDFETSEYDVLFDRDKFVNGMKELFGTSFGEFLNNIKSCSNAYQLSVKYLGMVEPTTFDLATHPNKLVSYLKMVNKEGRWNIKSHRYRYGETGDNGEPVKGFILWIVWIAEFAILIIPALGFVYGKAKYPYIESEEDWAIEEKPMPEFRFPAETGSPYSDFNMVKKEILRNPGYIFTLPRISVIAPPPDTYYFIKYCRSKYYDENFITVVHSNLVNARKNQRKMTEIIKNMRVDADFIATLYGAFELPVPPMCKGENRAQQVNAEAQARKKAQEEGRPLSPQRPKMTGAEAIFDEPSIFAKPKPKPEVPKPEAPSFAQQELAREQRAPQPTSGQMDGIDTSNLNLDDIDLTKM